ncbi:MAG: glutamate-5-semialdehyde dehydrogenase, partial [Rhodobiaceae bacterium]|nr:glutamate-5-semialdehyde dehydrogenase [Rhodobiaceae bacterium]
MDKRVDDKHGADLETVMMEAGRKARAAARLLATAPEAARNAALTGAADALIARQDEILSANGKDVEAAKASGTSAALVDRLTLTPDRIAGMAQSLKDIAALADPIGSVIAAWDRPNGLKIERVRTPLGVIGIIYESRPNVTSDAGGLCLKSGNAAILRGGSDSLNSARAIHACLVEGLASAGLPEDAIQIVPSRDRAAVGMMLAGLGGTIDVIVPRGGRGLVERVQSEARVPVFSHLEGICHVYVHNSAKPDMVAPLIVNAKMRRTGICGAAECVLIDRAVADTLGKAVVEALIDPGCEVRGDAAIQALDDRVVAATEADWGHEFLDAIIAMKVVDGPDEAIAHIARYSSSHTESILAEDPGVVEKFMNEVDSAIVMH